MAANIGPSSPADRKRYAEHAALESIVDTLGRALAERTRLDHQINWLESLLVTRARQIAEGTWPAP